MAQKLKITGIIGDWPHDEAELAAAIKEQERIVSLMCDIEDEIPWWELEECSKRYREMAETSSRRL